jgi:hypothetical protein
MLRAFLSHRRRLRQKAKRLVLELAFSSEERSGARVRPDRDRDMAA